MICPVHGCVNTLPEPSDRYMVCDGHWHSALTYAERSRHVQAWFHYVRGDISLDGLRSIMQDILGTRGLVRWVT